MTIDDILKNLPDSISWLVLFEIEGFKSVANEEVMVDMYFLNKDVTLSEFNYVILTNEGRYLSKANVQGFIHGETLEPYSYNGEDNLYSAYSELLVDYKVNDAQSFAVAEDPEFGKVLLYIQLKDGLAYSEGLFKNPPTQEMYEFLQAVGVRYVGGQQHDESFRAQFVNQLSTHIMSGTINDYSRTDNCNVFFFRHGRIDAFLKDGLFTAAQKRIAITLNRVKDDLKQVAHSCMNEKLSMTWLPPQGNETFPFGDLVPKGFVNRALKNVGETQIQSKLEADIFNKKLRGLWTFETDDLETSTDSVLVLQSVKDENAARQLDQFFDGKNGLYPQLWATEPKPGEMVYDPRKRHWCQADIATTAYAIALQKKNGLEVATEMVDFVIDSFDQRSDLYFANPYMIDWIYAQTLTQLEGTQDLQAKLKYELLNSLNEDYSFGQFDKVLSSAFGVLALLELGYEGNVISALQLHIINHYYQEKNGKNIPFYSSLINDEEKTEGRTVKVNDFVLDLSLHEDSHDMIYVSIVAMALNHQILPENLKENTLEFIENEPHGRYASSTIQNYVEQYALKPYMRAGLPSE